MSETTQSQSAEGLNPLRPRVLHTAYHVKDLDRSVAFYCGVLGMREMMRFQLPSGEWECVLTFNGEDGKPRGSGLILMWHPDRAQPYALGEGYSRVVLQIADVDAATTQLKQAGARITTPPSDAPGNMRYAMFQDPDGYTLELLQLGAARK